ncbi:MAG TPA: CdaR family protein [Terriglobales bacterium]|jgi:YbbR domain-containing protein
MRDFFRRKILNNIGLKLLSLALAVGLWLAIERDPIAQVAVDAPVEMQNLPDGLQISSEKIPPVQVTLSGPERVISRLQQSDVHAKIDLSQVQAGERSFDITANDVHYPNGLRVEEINPSELHLIFDSKATRSVEIKPRVVGQFASEYEIAKINVVPPTITIVGPKKRVQETDYAITDPVDVTGNTDRMSFSTHAYVSDPLIQIVNPDSIHVTVIMRKKAVGATP